MKSATSFLWRVCVAGFATQIAACSGFFGSKTDLKFIEQPTYNNKPVAYVPVQPVLKNFIRPVDVIAGWDELIYVADAGTEEIISFDQAGNELGRFKVQGLRAIAQDRKMDIVALGTRDTTVQGTAYTLPAVYRIAQEKTGAYGLKNAKITRILTHPFCFNKAATPTGADVAARFEGVAILGDNSYYVTRSGSGNGSAADAIVKFDANDRFQSPIYITTDLGIFSDYFKKPKAITSFIAPPQTAAISLSDGNFCYTSYENSVPFRSQVIQYQADDFGASYSIKQLPPDTSKANRFLYTTNRFTQPADVCVSGDGTNYIFMVDAARDSLYQFNAKGYEGVNPPPGYKGNKVILASFGGTGTGLTQFKQPSGVAYLNKIVYVADAGNGRVLRFKLTTDFE